MLQCCPLLTTDTIASPQVDTCCMSSDTNPVRVFTALYDIAVATGGVLEPVELARVVVNRARELLEAGAVGVYGLNESTQLLEPIYSSDARDALPEPPIPPGTGAAGQALVSGQLVRVDDYLNWPHAGKWAAANGATRKPRAHNERAYYHVQQYPRAIEIMNKRHFSSRVLWSM